MKSSICLSAVSLAFPTFDSSISRQQQHYPALGGQCKFLHASCPCSYRCLQLFPQKNLQATIQQANLLAKAQILEGFAYATEERNRVFGGPGHNATVNYLYDQIAALSKYYTVEFQPFVELYSAGSASLVVDGKDQGASLFTYSPSGKFSEALVAVANVGCEAVRVSPFPRKRSTLIMTGRFTRQRSPVRLLSSHAVNVSSVLSQPLPARPGADAAIIYDNVEGPALAGTLGAPPRPGRALCAHRRHLTCQRNRTP